MAHSRARVNGQTLRTGVRPRCVKYYVLVHENDHPTGNPAKRENAACDVEDLPRSRRVFIAIAVAALSLASIGPRSAWAQPAADTLAARHPASGERATEPTQPPTESTMRTATIGRRSPARTAAPGGRRTWARSCRSGASKWPGPVTRTSTTLPRAIVQISDAGGDGPWKDVLTIGADKIPADEAPFESDRSWDYPFPEAASLAVSCGCSFRMVINPMAKYDGYICLGEVQVQCPGVAPKLVSIEARFGKVEVDVAHPALVGLYLRGPDGQLSAQPLLAQRPTVAYGGYREGSGTAPLGAAGLHLRGRRRRDAA